MLVHWQPAAADLHQFLTGFVERRDQVPVGLSLELPLATPLLHVTLGAAYSFERHGDFEPMPRLSLWGFNARTRLTRPEGCIHAFVAVLTFRGADLLAPGAVSQAQGICLDLSLPLGRNAVRLLDHLESARGFSERCEVVQSHLRDLLRAGRGDRSSHVHDIAGDIAANRLRGSVASIANRFGLSERTLRNHFHADIAVSPKTLLRVARLNRVMRALHPSPWGGSHAADVRLEFFDDAHFHNEFRSLTGISPRDYVRRKGVSGDSLVYNLLDEPKTVASRM